MRFLPICMIWAMVCASPALSLCQGADLSTTLSPAQADDLAQRLDGLPYPDGNHWKATREDEVIHLIGTVHLSDPRLSAPLERLTPLVQSAGLLLLEGTQAEHDKVEQAMAGDPDLILMSDNSLPELLTDAEWDLLSQSMRARGMPPFMGAKMQPWVVSMALAIPMCLLDQFAPGAAFDKKIEDIADEAGVPTQALEPYDTAFRVLNDFSMDIQLAMLRSALLTPEGSEDMFETLLSSYFREDHAAGQVVLEILSPTLSSISVAETQALYDAFNETLLRQRNRDWIPVILDAAEQTEGIVVAAFGAGHLSGTQGVLQLLENEGFALTRLPF